MRTVFICFVAAAVVCAACGAEPLLERMEVFEAGKDGYALYRIPGLIVTRKGTVLACCEARRSGSDWSAIDLMVRRSTDGGKTWGPRQKLDDISGPKTRNPLVLAAKLANPDEITYNNPVAISDRAGAIHLLFCLE